jgi:hypothetical protein
MALPLVVEDGTGLTTANSYLTAVEADAILSVNPVFYAAWTALTPTEQDSFLVWASDYIDCYVQWNGYKTVETSGLRWPRECVTDCDGVLIASNVIPDKLKKAVAQLAIFLTTSEAAQSGGTASVAPPGIKRVKADVVEVEFFGESEGGGRDTRSGDDLLPVNMRFLIRCLGNVQTGRQRFAKVIR